MICKTCGREIQNDQMFCTYCGTIRDQGLSGNQAQSQDFAYLPPPGNQQVPPYQPFINTYSKYPQPMQKKSKAPLYIFLAIYIPLMIILVVFAFISSIRAALESEIIADNFSNPQLELNGDLIGPNLDEDDVEEAWEGDPFTYQEMHSYSELPEVLSIDSDLRFVLSNYYPATNGTVSYEFEFLPLEASEEDFYYAVNEYGRLLQEKCGFIFEQEYSDEQYADSGVLEYYYSKEETWLGIRNDSLGDGFYAYINIYLPVEAPQSGEQQESYDNYNFYITGRDQVIFDIPGEVSMENGITFRMEEINITDLGDGTSVFVAEVKMKSNIENTYFCLDDFLILPMDENNKMLADTTPAEYIKDEQGNMLSVPLELSQENYREYTISFLLPINTKYFTVYGVNYYNDTFAGPVYVSDMVVEE